ncbi:MAG: hypothetical protein ACRDGE_08590 [Candidatus Limnocylindria bacterium]
MVVLADSAVWVGVVGTVVGGLIGILGSLLVHRWARAERLRAERKEAYGAFLAKTEDSLHLFQWLAEGHLEDGWKEDTAKANRFYDQEVTPRLMVLKIIGTRGVVEAASELRRPLNELRKLMLDEVLGPEDIPMDESPPFKQWHESYREARDTFIELARADLEREGRRRKHRFRSLGPVRRAGAR